MVTTKLNLSMTEPSVRQIYAKQGDTGRVLDIALDQTPEDGTLRILRPDGVEVTSEAVTGGEVSESGETVTFESMTEADVTELTVGIEPVQDLSHGDPSPSNICPITGHDEVRVTDEGKNKYPILIGEDRWENNASATHTNEDGTLKIEMSASVGSGVYGNYTLSAITPLSASLPQGSYTISFDAMSSVAGGVRIRYENLGTSTFNLTTDWQRYSFTVNLIGEKTAFIIYNSIATAKTVYVKNFQIEQGSTATAYEPYQGSTYTTPLGQTVYGGTLDMVTGVLTVDKAMVDLGSLTWVKANGYRFAAPLVEPQIADTAHETAICSQYALVVAGGTYGKLQGFTIAADTYIYIYDGTLESATASQFKTAMDGVTCVYSLATPQTYQLTAQQIKTLVGTNNAWASSGDIVSIKFAYGGLLSELPSDATEIVGKCYCDVEQNGVSSMPFTLNVKKNERES